MKTVKNITSGIAVLLCVFICIYLLTLYLKFEPKEPEILDDGTVEEIPGKIEQFLDSDVNIGEHLDLFFLLALSAAAGFLLDKMPAFGVLTSASALAYALTMHRFEALPKFPNAIVILCIAHAAGALFYAATSERGEKHSFLHINSAASGGMLCNAAALGICAWIFPILQRMSGLTEKIEELGEHGIIITAKFAAVPDLVDMLWRTFKNHGQEMARLALLRLSRQYETEGVAEAFEMTFVGEEASVYLKLGILLFGVIILSLVFRRRAWVGAVLSVIPPLYVFGSMMYDKLSTATLALLALTAFGAIGAFAAYQREGAPALIGADGEEIEIEEDDDPFPEEIPASDSEDDTENEDRSDEECERLDYFYERPRPEPTPEERDEYLEIEKE